jgi:hypothetical protein
MHSAACRNAALSEPPFDVDLARDKEHRSDMRSWIFRSRKYIAAGATIHA